MAAAPGLAWVTHPRHLPAAPAGRVVVVDVAFAAGAQWKSKTKKVIDALGERLVLWIDHHEHKEGWAQYRDDARFVLVPNKVAHGSPELVTRERVLAAGPVDVIMAHADFDGVVAAAKWLKGGVEPWPGADEDARAVDSPGRGHALTERGARFAYAFDEASVAYKQAREHALLTKVTLAMASGESDLGLDEELDGLAKAARASEQAARARAAREGELAAPGVFLVKVDERPDNRTRRNLLVYAEERALIGALLEPDPQGGHWLIATTFDERLDLSEVEGFEGGRSDYRFARAHAGGGEQIAALAAYARRFA
ncbi:MAG: hypothetical protein HYS27_22220 [Deltaproteobacteria bacterium]|nr:hypothetical protein [Deltaproteobacteria bacterium]